MVRRCNDTMPFETYLLGALHVSSHSSAVRCALEIVLTLSADELLDISQHIWQHNSPYGTSKSRVAFNTDILWYHP